MILILSGTGDTHAGRVQAELERRGVAVSRLDPDRLSTFDRLELQQEAEHVRAVYCGEPDTPATHAQLEELWEMLDVGVIPGTPSVVERARDSELQACAAALVGFDLRSERDELPTRIRVVVVGYRVFAAALLPSPAEPLSLNIWDACIDRDGISPAMLPVALAERCRELVEQMGLEFATLDIALNGDGTAVFCGLNPFGHFACVEDGTGMPITRAVVDLLLTEAAGSQDVSHPAVTHPSRVQRQLPFLRVARARQ